MVRIKERYLLVNIVYPPDAAKPAKTSVPDFVVHHQPTREKVTPQTLLKAIRAEVADLFGDFGSGSVSGNLSVKYLSLATSTFIIRCSRDHYRLLWSALTLMNRVPAKDGRPCIFRVVRVSGTIRKAEEEAIRQAKKLILAANDDNAASAGPHTTRAFHKKDQVMLDVTEDSSDNAMEDEDDDEDEDEDEDD